MRRSVATIVGTLAGTALLIGAKLGTHAAGTLPVAAAGPVDPLAVPASPTAAASSGPPAPSPAARKSPGVKPTPTKAKPPASGLKDGTYTGGGASERYGTITVRITVSGGRLTDANGSCSGCGGTSQAISNSAFPQLRQEALSAQNARIATVSGATYTSSAYRASLQSALDAAKA